MNPFPVLVAFAFASLVAGANAARPGGEPAGEKFVYEMPTQPSARVVLRAVEKHLEGAGGRARITVVAHGGGVEALLVGSRDETGVAYSPAIERLAARGVDFAVCGATLRIRRIAPDRVVAQGHIVDSGNSELARLAHDGYVRLN
jgi:uncharacterized protein